MKDLIYSHEAYEIIGKCMEVHSELGHGFLEIVYKDALEKVFFEDGIFLNGKRNISLSLEMKY